MAEKISSFPEIENKINKKWRHNRKFMSKSKFEQFIERQLNSENYQFRIIDKFELYFNKADGKKGGKILDVGCGEGGLCVALNKRGYEAYGIDIKEENIEIAKLRARRNGLVQEIFQKGSAYNLQFENDTFDAVILFNVLEHLEFGIKEVLAECNRVLKDGGLFYSVVPNKYSLFEGHVNLPMVHLLPIRLRTFVLKKYRPQKAIELNYLSDINYFSQGKWKQILRVHFNKVLSPHKAMMFSVVNSRYRFMASIFFKPFQILFPLIKHIYPTAYLIAEK